MHSPTKGDTPAASSNDAGSGKSSNYLGNGNGYFDYWRVMVILGIVYGSIEDILVHAFEKYMCFL